MLAVGSDQPNGASRPVRLDVEIHPHIGDAAAVGRYLRIACPLQIEDVERPKGGFRGLRHSRRGQRE